jgi:hypothetical protein
MAIGNVLDPFLIAERTPPVDACSYLGYPAALAISARAPLTPLVLAVEADRIQARGAPQVRTSDS